MGVDMGVSVCLCAKPEARIAHRSVHPTYIPSGPPGYGAEPTHDVSSTLHIDRDAMPGSLTGGAPGENGRGGGGVR